MIKLAKTISSVIDNLTRRIVTVYLLGRTDVQEAIQSAPYGIDSNPIKDMVAVFAQTGERGKTVIVGYLNKNQIAAIGETRLYSTDEDGNVKISIYLKNDGTAELAGNEDNLVRFVPLDDFVGALNNFFNQQLPLIASGIATGGGSYTPGTANFNISGAKIDELKTSG